MGPQSGQDVADDARDFAGDVETVFGEFELATGVFVLFAMGLDAQDLLRALALFLGGGDVDLLAQFGDFGEDRDLVRQDFGETPRAGQVLLLAGGVGVTDLTDSEFGDKWRVPGEDTDVAIAAGDRDLRRIVADEPMLRSDDFEFDDFSHWSLVVGR